MALRVPLLVLVVAVGLAWALARAETPRGADAETRGASAERIAPSAGPRLSGAALARTIGDDDEAEDLVPLAPAPPAAFGVIASVVGDDGKAVAGAPVVLRLEAPEPVPFEPMEATTDAAGEARFGPMPPPIVPRRLLDTVRLAPDLVGEDRGVRAYSWIPRGIGRQELTGWLPPHSPASIDPSSTEEVRWFRMQLRRAEGIPVTGRVTTKDGVGIPEVVVYEESTWKGSAETDHTGTFHLRVGAPGVRQLRVHLTTWGERTPSLIQKLRVPEEGLSGLHWVLPDVGIMAGRAVEADGTSATGAELFLTRSGEALEEAQFWSRSTSFFPPASLYRRCVAGPDGRFRFVGTLRNSSYDVRWLDDEGQEHVGAGEVRFDVKSLVVPLRRHGVLARLVDAHAGRPVHGVVRYRHGELQCGGGGFHWPPRQEGCLAPPGSTVWVHAAAPGYADVAVQHTVSSRPGLDDFEVRLQSQAASPRVRLRCVGVTGRPMPFPSVSWVHEPSGIRLEPRWLAEGNGIVTTDLDGGRYVVQSGDGAPGGGELRFVLAGTLSFGVPEAGDVDQEWVLREGGSLRLEYQDATSAACEPGDMRCTWVRNVRGEEAMLRLFRPKGDGTWEEGTGVVGPYETQALTPGDYEVRWYAGASPASSLLATERVHVPPGEVTPVRLRRARNDR